MLMARILRGPHLTSICLVAAAAASCAVVGTYVWTAERAATETRLLEEVRQRESILLDLIDSVTAIADLLLQEPEILAAFDDYNGGTAGAEILSNRLQPTLESWLLRSSTISGMVIRAADGSILGKGGKSLMNTRELPVAPIAMAANDVLLHTFAGTGQAALTLRVGNGIQGATGSLTLLLSEFAHTALVREGQSRWESAHYALVTQTPGHGPHLVLAAFDRSGELERRIRALDLQAPGLMYLEEMVLAWSALGAHSAGVLGRVGAEEFSRPAVETALLVTSSAATVFLLAGMLMMLRSRQITRRLEQELGLLRGELASQIRDEQALLATTAQMSTAARLAAIGHWVTQRTEKGWIWTAATQEVARIYGVSRRRLIGGLGFSRHLVHPEDQARMHAMWDEVNRKPRRYEAEFRVLQPSGDVRHVVEVGEPMFDQDGALSNFHGTMQDITEYRHSERVVSEAEARLRQPPKSATVCHWVSYENPNDVSDSRYTYSRSAVNLFGVPMEQLPVCLGDMSRFIHPEDLARVTEQYRQSTRSPAAYCIYYRLLRPDGSMVWMEEVSEPAFAPGGGITHTFGTMTEVAAPPPWRRIEQGD